MSKPIMRAAAAVAALAVVVPAYFLARFPASNESAWSRLPPGTTWAAEARGAMRLLGRGLDDPGVRFLLRRGAEELDAAARLEQAMDLYGVLSGLFAALGPDRLLAGRGAHGWFAFCRPPAGTGALVGTHPVTTHFPSIGAHLALHDGMLVAAENAEAIDDIVKNWNADARPLGPAPVLPAEGVAIAVAGEMTAGSGGRLPTRPSRQIPPLAPRPPQPGGMLAFRNPFAANAGGAGGPATESAPAGPELRLTVTPAPDGWDISGLAGEWPGFAGEAEEIAAELPEAPPSALLPAGRDVAAAAAFSGPAREAWLARLPQLAGLHSTAPPRAAPLLAWLRESLLGRIGNNVTLLAGAPAKPGRGYAAIPGLALGWTWNSPPANDDFRRGLTEGLTALLAPDGSALAEVLRAAVRWREAVTALGSAVVVTLPPPLVSGAEVTCLAGTDGLGWLASSPEALPPAAGEGGELLAGVPPPADGDINVHAAWRITPAFRAGAAAFAAERWRAVPERRRRELPALPRAARWAERVLAAYPNGSLAARVRAAPGPALFHAAMRRDGGEAGE